MSSRLLVVPSDVNCLNIGGGLSPTGIIWQKYPLLLMFFISEASSFPFASDLVSAITLLLSMVEQPDVDITATAKAIITSFFMQLPFVVKSNVGIEGRIWRSQRRPTRMSC